MDAFDRLIEIVKHLRSDEGCPWDRQQTAESLVPYLVEELHEYVDSLDRDDHEERKKELGDLFLHLVFQGVLAEEKGEFTISGSLDSISDKLVSRHPHVFGDAEYSGEEELNRRWEQQKLREGRKYTLDGIPVSLPTLHRSYRIQEKAAARGFDWNSSEGVLDKIREEIGELEAAREGGDREEMMDEMGDILFSIVNLCRWMRINPDEALRKANNKFSGRFRLLEEQILTSGRNFSEFSIEELEEIWQTVKKNEQ